MKKRWIIGLFLVLVLAVASFVLVRYRQEQEYLSSHVFLGEDVYPMDARQIDLRGRDVTMEYHSQLQALLPACEILWDVPFQGGKVSWDVLCQQGRFSLTPGSFGLLSIGTVPVDMLSR